MGQWLEFSTNLFDLHYNSKVDPNHSVMGIILGTHAEGRVFQKQAIGFWKIDTLSVMALQNRLDLCMNFLNVAGYIWRVFVCFHSQPFLLDFNNLWLFIIQYLGDTFLGF